MSTLFIEPLDVLFLRGNKLFGDPGSYGESLVPPWPSVAAGALRSLMLATDGIDPAAFAKGRHVHPTLGTPAEPGTFTLTGFDLARRDAAGRVASLHVLPADLIVSDDGGGRRQLRRLSPHAPADGLISSAPLARWPVLAEAQRSKPVGGLWLTQSGWAEYLAGRHPSLDHLVSSADLWRIDARVGVGLDPTRRRADDGKLFSAQAVVFARGVGFVASVGGAEPPSRGMLRLGGDGRGAAICEAGYAPAQPDWDGIARAGRCRIVLTTPGLFEQGWMLPGVDAERRLALHGVHGRVVCAAVPRAEVVSGWNLATREPKPAQRAAPAGSVYWLDELEASAEQLRKLAEHGLWANDDQNTQRRAEGFNRFTFAAY